MVKLRSLKVVLAALCSAVPENKYRCKLVVPVVFVVYFC